MTTIRRLYLGNVKGITAVVKAMDLTPITEHIQDIVCGDTQGEWRKVRPHNYREDARAWRIELKGTKRSTILTHIGLNLGDRYHDERISWMYDWVIRLQLAHVKTLTLHLIHRHQKLDSDHLARHFQGRVAGRTIVNVRVDLLSTWLLNMTETPDSPRE